MFTHLKEKNLQNYKNLRDKQGLVMLHKRQLEALAEHTMRGEICKMCAIVLQHYGTLQDTKELEVGNFKDGMTKSRHG